LCQLYLLIRFLATPVTAAVAIEATQFVFGLGTSDIDDVLLNSIDRIIDIYGIGHGNSAVSYSILSLKSDNWKSNSYHPKG
jgi:hypothetical protein